MRSARRASSVVFTLFLIVAVMLTACSGNKNNNAAETPAGSASPSATASASEEATPEPLPVIDIELMNYAVNLDNVEGIANDRIKKAVEEKNSVRLTYKTGTPDDYVSKIMTSMAAGDAADLILANVLDVKNVFPDWVREGMVVDIGKIVNANPERYKALKLMIDQPYAKFYNEYVSGDPDAYYGVYAVHSTPRAYGGYIFNNRYLKALNLQLPTTIDEFVEVLRAIKNGDPDGNGKKDTIPFSFLAYGGVGFYGSLNPLFTSNGTTPKGFYQNEAGEWEDGAISDKSREVYTLLASMYKEGLIDKEVMTHDPPYKLIDDFAAGRTAVVDVQAPAPGQYNWVLDVFKQNFADATTEDVAMLPEPLKGWDGKYAVDAGAPFGSNFMSFIPSSTENPERVLDLLNWFVSDEGQFMTWYGAEGIHYTKDASGNINWNKEEYRKEANIYLGDTPDRLQYYYFSLYANDRQRYMPMEKYGSLLEGLANAQDLITERYGANPGLEYAAAIEKVYLEKGYKPLEPYYNFVSYSEEDNKIDAAVSDIRNKWLLKFIIGQDDITKNWDKYVKEYKDAGGDRLKQAYIDSLAAQKAKFDAMQ